MQLPLFETPSTWQPPSMSKLPSWAGAKRIAIDVETKDPQITTLGPGVRRDGKMVGVSFAIEEGPSFYLPFGHDLGDNLPESKVLDYLRYQAKNFRGLLVGANLSYDLDWLWENDIYFPQVRSYADVQIAEPLIDELQMNYSLQAIAERHNFAGKDEYLLREAANSYHINKKPLDPKKDLWRLPARYVGAYAEQDVVLPLKIFRHQERLIEEQDLWRIFELESQVLPALVRMRRRGVLIDQTRLSEIERWSLQEETKALQEVRRITGINIEVGHVWRAEALAPALAQQGIEVSRTKTGKPSVKKEALDGIDNPVAKLLNRARKVNKVRTTFAASIWQHMTNGRIHGVLNQLRKTEDQSGEEESKGAAYGRLSGQNPNMQQQPARDPEIGPMWRSIYLPEPGTLWAAKDYSQQEPRMTTHFAEVCGLPMAKEAGDAYRNDPNCDNHQMMADMAGIHRKQAKEIYLGITYGMGGPKMCSKLGLPTRWAVSYGPPYARTLEHFSTYSEATDRQHELVMEGEQARAYEVAGEEGQRLLDAVDQRVPFLKKLAKLAEKRAKDNGYIITLGGRRCRFPQAPDGSYEWTHKALNRLIQGSSADQTKKAVVEVDAAGYFIQLQVHDEIDGSYETVAQAEQAAEIMRTCMPIRVPSKVDVEVGPSWGEAK